MKPMKIMRGCGSYRYQQQQRRKKLLVILASALALVLVALCVFFIIRGVSSAPSGDTAIPIAAAAQVNSQKLSNGEKVDLSLAAGEICILELPADVDLRTVTFTCDDSSVVRVDSAGRIDALQEGSAKIIATAKGFNAICECSVKAAEKPKEGASKEGGDALLTTAYTANADIVAKNAKKGADKLYSITVNRRTNTVTVYTFDEKGAYTVPVRAMVCSCGKGGDDATPTGRYAVTDYKIEWLSLSGNVYGQYISQFYDNYLFHSVPYRTQNPGDLKAEEFNKLGENASEGCVRLMISDVLWIYDNCPKGTPVEVIDSDESVDPLGKPPAVRISPDAKWDPTDPDPDNPFKGKQPEITGAVDSAMDAGGSFNPMQGVAARDACGNDITDRVQLAGLVVSEKPGVYYLTYSVEDDFRQRCEVTRVVIVNNQK